MHALVIENEIAQRLRDLTALDDRICDTNETMLADPARVEWARCEIATFHRERADIHERLAALRRQRALLCA